MGNVSTLAVSEASSKHAWVCDLEDDEFIAGYKLRGMTIEDILLMYPVFPLDRSAKLIGFFLSLKPSRYFLYRFLLMADSKKVLVQSCIDYIRVIEFPPSLLAHLIHLKRWTSVVPIVEIFLASFPSAMDYCLVMCGMQRLESSILFLGFMDSSPSPIYVDYLSNVVKLDMSKFVEDEHELNNAVRFVSSVHECEEEERAWKYKSRRL